MELLISTTGEAAIQRRFRKLERNLEKSEIAFTEIQKVLEESEKRSWGRGVKLSPETIATKERKGLALEPLVATGQLKASLTDTGASEAIREIRLHEMRYGTKVFYAGFQQHGTKKMLRHRVMKITPLTRKAIKAILNQHLFH